MPKIPNKKKQKRKCPVLPSLDVSKVLDSRKQTKATVTMAVLARELEDLREHVNRKLMEITEVFYTRGLADCGPINDDDIPF